MAAVVTSPPRLDGRSDAEGHAEVADLPRLREAAHLRDLEVDDVHRSLGVRAQQHVDAVDRLVEHEGMAGAPAHGQAFLEREAGLLDVDVDVRHRADHARRLVLEPAGVGVGHQHVRRLQLRGPP
jgi:hypothetical protein